jgi:hypothetical protein
MSRQDDDVRLSYERHTAQLPRQCVIWGTTNDTEYLRDKTGGRRFLPIIINMLSIDPLAIMRARNGLWRAAYEAFVDMVAKTPTGSDLPLFLKGEGAVIGKRLQERARKTEAWETWALTIEDWTEDEVSLQSFLATKGSDIEDTLGDNHMGVPYEATVKLVAFCQADAIRQALGLHGNVPNGAQADQCWKQAMAHFSGLGWTHEKTHMGGKRKHWMLRPDITKLERARGFRVCNSAQATESGYAQVDDDPDIEDLI